MPPEHPSAAPAAPPRRPLGPGAARLPAAVGAPPARAGIAFVGSICAQRLTGLSWSLSAPSTLPKHGFSPSNSDD